MKVVFSLSIHIVGIISCELFSSYFDSSSSDWFMAAQVERVLLITANVGSLFEQDRRLQDAWLKTFTERINEEMADFVVIHMQETGGKHYVECAWQVPKLIDELLLRMPMYPAVQTYLDLDHTAPNFTALGSVILVKARCIGSVSQYNFKTSSYLPVVKGVNILLDGLENSPLIIKKKFPKDFWPTFKWGRKGILDFVNVHLFHDESNLALIHENPFLYSTNRKRALDYVLDQLTSSGSWSTSHCFVFGDFNFRLDSTSFLNRLTERASAHPLEEPHGSVADGLLCASSATTPETLRRTVSAIEFRRESLNEISSGLVLRIERKRFDYFNQKKLLDDWKSYLEDDREARNFAQLHELPISFPPTYPWSEDPDESEVMMKTRAPAWCDRVLMNDGAFALVRKGSSTYSSFGRDVCTGDHKPVALAFSMSS
ncbi:unnamed protein product [Strongylus vulgaris]|uniref:inositol-polyphosphate 5-phosphatase n=1 Tax=Strongylus vulgaris TaxID=40348 RepID=A0A3P7J4C5_STRVU|nr:unnamed protein product [Strongylus vulgaris]